MCTTGRTIQLPGLRKHAAGNMAVCLQMGPSGSGKTTLLGVCLQLCLYTLAFMKALLRSTSLLLILRNTCCTSTCIPAHAQPSQGYASDGEGHVWTYGLLWSERQESEAMDGLCQEDLQFAGLSSTWWRKSHDRAGWRAAIECLLQRT